MHLCINVTYVKIPWKLEESMGSPGAGVTGNCHPPDVGAGNRTWFPQTAASALKHQGLSPALALVLLLLPRRFRFSAYSGIRTDIAKSSILPQCLSLLQVSSGLSWWPWPAVSMSSSCGTDGSVTAPNSHPHQSLQKHDEEVAISSPILQIRQSKDKAGFTDLVGPGTDLSSLRRTTEDFPTEWDGSQSVITIGGDSSR